MQFTKDDLIFIYEKCKGKAVTFITDQLNGGSQPCVLIRHDVDDDLDKSVRNAELQFDLRVQATYFILNTAPYFDNSKEMWDKVRYIQGLGHEVGWHNNSLVQFRDKVNQESVNDICQMFRDNGILLYGSASHGDGLCRELGVINYEVFIECKRKPGTFPDPTFRWERFPMSDVGLTYEAYFTKRDEYFSEPGGVWNKPLDLYNMDLKRTQILIHPQWWAI